MAVYATKPFQRFARKAKFDAVRLLDAARAVAEGHADADLGGGLFKQRVARGGGKSGGFRVVLAFRAENHTFFLHGFAKNAKANVSEKELAALKEYAATLFALSKGDVDRAVESRELTRLDEADDQASDEGR